MELMEVVELIQDICHENVECWSNSDKPVSRFGVIPGGGVLTSYVKECVDRDCDLYITGEKNLYTVMYAKHAGVHLIVGGHTFTEIFGVEALVELIKSKYPEINSVRLEEPHLEKPPNHSMQRTFSRR
jgi:putative NIF3 family GTP cyclohydrolase 1 type 2